MEEIKNIRIFFEKKKPTKNKHNKQTSIDRLTM